MFKAIALSLSVLFATPLVAYADPGKGQQRMEMMAERLQLTDAQKEKVSPIMQQAMEERRAILKGAGIERGKKPTIAQLREVRGPMQESREKLDQQMAQVLSTEQMATFREMQQEMRDKMRKKFREGK
ncbi:hypothetical protein PSE_p0279 (plasmid) [Pseudovibrio sp. FO-BEG1]|uniref:hypothetical protein n=1 Tax=Pseudovibrio sp. (strain FO-BEG1) TaxID=911045 RepID=UPI000238D0B4|nr:hypothetical protein [Pseudovibrio sp. FO-BEG1]AEV39861.1 hypothetical protein PSE_p0279 [Pseudovibrio sp. FO-BEG1]